VEELNEFEAWGEDTKHVKSWTKDRNKDGHQMELMREHFEARRKEGLGFLFHPCKW